MTRGVILHFIKFQLLSPKKVKRGGNEQIVKVRFYIIPILLLRANNLHLIFSCDINLVNV